MSVPNSPSSPSPGVRLIRAFGVLLLGYVLVMTFTVPLGPGIVDVRVSPGDDRDVKRRSPLTLKDTTPISPKPFPWCF